MFITCNDEEYKVNNNEKYREYHYFALTYVPFYKLYKRKITKNALNLVVKYSGDESYFLNLSSGIFVNLAEQQRSFIKDTTAI